MGEPSEVFGDYISIYTRSQAVEDGVLVDVSEVAKEAGIKYPVALTQAVWSGYVVPDLSGRRRGQSESGRLWDILWVFRVYAAKAPTSTLLFKVLFQIKGRLKEQILKAVIGPGDTAEPVITIMLPWED